MQWTNAIQRKCGDDCAIDVKFSIAKWIFVGCIIFSFLLASQTNHHIQCEAALILDCFPQLGYETWKAKKAVMSRDISYAFTNLIANDYYSLSKCHHSIQSTMRDDRLICDCRILRQLLFVLSYRQFDKENRRPCLLRLFPIQRYVSPSRWWCCLLTASQTGNDSYSPMVQDSPSTRSRCTHLPMPMASPRTSHHTGKARSSLPCCCFRLS